MSSQIFGTGQKQVNWKWSHIPWSGFWDRSQFWDWPTGFRTVTIGNPTCVQVMETVLAHEFLDFINAFLRSEWLDEGALG